MYEAIVFYAFGAVLIASGVLVVTARNPVHGVLFLVLAFFTAAAIWLLLRAEFLAIALVVVYVGAVMVLFLFVVMMLDINVERVRQGFWRNLPLAVVVGGIMVAEMVLVLSRGRFSEALAENVKPLPPDYSNTRALGQVLYTDYAYAFEIAAVILLVAIIAAIALTLRKRKDTRAQDVSVQLRARREERVRLVSMPAEKDS
jgi:NADH-quinone oxidoreductase subunit J